MRARKLLLAVAVTGMFTLVTGGLRAQTGGQTPATQNTGQKNWKDRAEYDLYDAIKNDSNPQSKLEKLNQWKAKYPSTDFEDLREAAFLTTYAQVGKIAESLGIAKDMLAKNPNDFRALYYTALLTPQLAALNVTPTDDQLSTAEKAANSILGGAKPADVKDEEWQKAKGDVEAIAHKTLGWVAMQRKQWDPAEAEFKKSLGMNPKDSEIAYWLGRVILEEHKSEKQSEALYYYARAAAYDGPGALAAAGRDQVKKQFTDLYTRYHGSAEGLDQVLQMAKAEPTPKPDFKVVSTAEIQEQAIKKQQAEDAAHPDLALWRQLKTELTGANGAGYFESSMKGALLPEFTGRVVSISPAVRPKTVVVAVENGTTPDATLKFETALPGKVDPGTAIKFQGVPESYSANPFMITFLVDKSKLQGWTGTNPAPVHRGPTHRRPTK